MKLFSMLAVALLAVTFLLSTHVAADAAPTTTPGADSVDDTVQVPMKLLPGRKSTPSARDLTAVLDPISQAMDPPSRDDAVDAVAAPASAVAVRAAGAADLDSSM